MACVGDYEIKLPMYEKFTKNNKCIHIDGNLENGLMYLYFNYIKGRFT